MDYEFALIEKKEVAEGTMEFIWDISSVDYPYKAGQNTDWTLANPPYTDDEGNTRTFSFVTPPSQKGVIAFTTRMRDTAFKNSLKELSVGSTIHAKEAMGHFFLHKDAAKPAVFLAGGIGITPFMSMIRESIATKSGHDLTLFYSNRDLAGTAFYNELDDLAREHTNFHFVPTLTDEQPQDWSGESSRIDEAMLNRHVKDLSLPIFYVAGPPGMVSALTGLLEKAGVPEEHIKAEDFAGY